jgi:hypothetical protein
MNERPQRYVAYLVRLWQVGQTEVWRASATDPHTGEQRLFVDIQSLCAFLRDATRMWDAGDAGDAGDKERGDKVTR